MSITTYHILHVFAVLVLTGYTFFAFAGPAPETRRKVMMITGIASLVIVITGYGMLARMQLPMALWVYLKTASWLGLSALSGVAYRRREKANLLALLAALALFVAVFAVYTRPA